MDLTQNPTTLPHPPLRRAGAEEGAPDAEAAQVEDRSFRLRRLGADAAEGSAASASTPAWGRPALIGLLVATALLYLWGLGQSGWANSFYSAAVQAGSESWK